MKRLLVLLMICSMFTACGIKENANVGSTEANQAAQSTEVAQEGEAAEAATIAPLPTTIDVEALDNCTVAVSFEEGDAYVDDTGAMMLDVTVYTYDLYDMVDMANIKEGDTFVVQENDVLVESVERLESGLVIINGGIENGGYDMWHNDTGVYYEQGMSDAKSYYAIGEATLPVSADFEFVDGSDPDKGEVTYYPGDFLTEDTGIMYNFVPNNTNIVIEDGKVVAMTRIYTP